MPNRCVVYGCSNVAKPKEGVFLFTIPFYGDERPEAKKRRKLWVKFVDIKRKNFMPTKGSCICSKHFSADSFTIRFSQLPGQEKPMIPRLIRDDVGVSVVPSIQAEILGDQMISSRKRRKIVNNALNEYRRESSQSSSNGESVLDASSTVTVLTDNETVPNQDVDKEVQNNYSNEPSTSEERAEKDQVDEFAAEPVEDAIVEINTKSDKKMHVKHLCKSCTRLRREKAMWKMRWERQTKLLKETKEMLLEAKQKVTQLEKDIQSMHDKQSVTQEHLNHAAEDEALEDEISDISSFESDDESDDYYATETESEDDEPITEEEVAGHSEILNMNDKNLRTEPKHIVFLSQLLLLFRFCHNCKADNPLVEAKEVGTDVVISTFCGNPTCQQKEYTWHSQPWMKYSSGQRGPAGNFLLSMAILFAGGSASKILTAFKHMSIGCMSLRTFFKHQRNYLFPTIHLHWKQYQMNVLSQLKGSELVVAGDARHDSMGHNAKYGAYSMLCCNKPQIFHFSLVQRNQAESSNAMEFIGFKNCMEFLLESQGLQISTFISDRHTSISSHMSKNLANIKHFYDLWHLKKKIRKVLTKLAKEKQCECVKPWVKPCENHLYWSAMSTHNGDGQLIWAKFKSFLSHVVNQHDNLDEPLFNKCAHREIRDRTWLEKGSDAHDKLAALLTKKSLQNGIMKASPIEQTSSIEGFHSVVNYFSPKMIAYSYPGMYCRHILAILHFNENLDRDVKKGADGKEQLRVSYPKFKNGEATVRNITVAQKYGYVDDLYNTFLSATKEEIQNAREEIKEMTPSPMNSILEKQSVADAVQKRNVRKSITVQDVPATSVPVITPVQDSVGNVVKPTRKCKRCKKPVKGHKRGVDCTKK